ncbi:hypothetical protein HOS55_gp087 [Pseudomonas phage PMBT3]|uniref:Uncharacterized protein n=1 Tax=Pseudomonas phage PMBT3 TaxID=2059856 RepID=A0A2I6PI05_9CAUD|nr:hypothetical protein HOS55_gp087 [Pseudomonas phage PMBT3]AUM59689.1 hypothetical protein [Pseudomonas phage PMBT3]
MRAINLEKEEERKAFVLKAAAAFAGDPKMRTYTDGPIIPGKPFAVRWGADEDCIVVLQLDDFAEVLLYENVVERS